MLKLKIDDAAMRLVAVKMEGHPIVSGPDGKLLAPGLIDLVDGRNTASPWQPADQLARLLVVGGEACRDLVFHAQPFFASGTRRRATKSMAVPVCTLMDKVADLLVEYNDEESRHERRRWRREDQKTYVFLARRLNHKRRYGPVRDVRNRMAAHLDSDVLSHPDVRIDVDELLGAMGDALILIMLILNHRRRSPAWIRGLGATADGRHLFVETMFQYPACLRWMTDLEGNVEDVTRLTLAVDPMHEVQGGIYEALDVYNSMCAASDSKLPSIWTAPREDMAEQWTGEVVMTAPLSFPG